jgi:hypothetical protein
MAMQALVGPATRDLVDPRMLVLVGQLMTAPVDHAIQALVARNMTVQADQNIRGREALGTMGRAGQIMTVLEAQRMMVLVDHVTQVPVAPVIQGLVEWH